MTGKNVWGGRNGQNFSLNQQLWISHYGRISLRVPEIEVREIELESLISSSRRDQRSVMYITNDLDACILRRTRSQIIEEFGVFLQDERRDPRSFTSVTVRRQKVARRSRNGRFYSSYPNAARLIPEGDCCRSSPNARDCLSTLSAVREVVYQIGCPAARRAFAVQMLHVLGT